MPYILAFDVGTTAVKAVLIGKNAEVIYSAVVDVTVYRPQPNWVEQEPDELWDSLCRASRACTENWDVSEIAGIIISAPWRHVIPLDENFHPLRRSIIWMDGRAIEQAAALNKAMGRFVEHAQGYWTRLLWLKENEPEIWKQAKHMAGINDYFRWKATGHLCTECSDDFIHSPDESIQRFYDEVLEKTGLIEDVEKFPEAIACTDVVGGLTAQAAQELGLQEGTPMIGGFGDLPAVYSGSGCQEPGTAHIYLGTSSWFGEYLPERLNNYSSNWFTADTRHQGALFGLTTGGRAYEWIIDRFYAAEREQLGSRIYELLDQEMSQVNPGCDGLIVTHWLNGEPPPISKNARAVFFNVSEVHRRQHFVRAMLEGICYSHRRSLEKYISVHGKPPACLRVVGGGACSEVWMQMMADILKMPVHVPQNPRYIGVMGLYQCALKGLGLTSELSSRTEQEKVYRPNPAHAAVYDTMYQAFMNLYPSLKELYDQINGVY